MDMITVTARTMDEAVTKALIEFETTGDKLEYKVIDKENIGSSGIGVEPAIIHAKKKESTKDKVMDFLSQIFKAMDMQMNVTTAYNRGEQELSLDLEGEDIGILIGKRGQTLDSLQYLASLIANKGTKGYLRIKLDTENYHKGRKETLETLAKNVAYKAKGTKRPVSLGPMSPYERRIIHAALQNDRYVTTRSEGEEPFRHVVVVPKKEAASGDRRGRYDRNKGGRYECSDRSGGYRNNRRTNGNNASQTSSDVSAETAADEEEQAYPWLIECRQ